MRKQHLIGNTMIKKQLMLGAIATSALTLGAVAIAPHANALSLSGRSCSTDVVFTGADVSGCDGNFSGNDSESEVNSGTGLFGTGLFGETDWKFFSKLDDQSGVDPTGVTVGSLNSDGEQSWEFSSGVDLTSYEQVAFVLKGGPNFSAYLWDGVSNSGVFNTQGLFKGGKNPKSGPNLSHFSIYYRGVNPVVPPGPTPVPTPAAVLPIIGSMIGAASRRRKKNESTDA